MPASAPHSAGRRGKRAPSRAPILSGLRQASTAHALRMFPILRISPPEGKSCLHCAVSSSGSRLDCASGRNVETVLIFDHTTDRASNVPGATGITCFCDLLERLFFWTGTLWRGVGALPKKNHEYPGILIFTIARNSCERGGPPAKIGGRLGLYGLLYSGESFDFATSCVSTVPGCV